MSRVDLSEGTQARIEMRTLGMMHAHASLNQHHLFVDWTPVAFHVRKARKRSARCPVAVLSRRISRIRVFPWRGELMSRRISRRTDFNVTTMEVNGRARVQPASDPVAGDEIGC